MIKEIFKKLPKSAKTLWEDTHNRAGKIYSNETAERIAWTAVKNRLHKTEDVWTAREEDFQNFKTVSYEFVADKVTTGRSENGFTFIDYVLSSNAMDSHGTRIGVMALNNFVDKINSKEVVGRVESKHNLLGDLKHRGLSSEEIEEYMNSMNTGIKAVSAKITPDKKVVATIRVKDELVQEVKDIGVSAEFSYPVQYENQVDIPTAELRSFILTPNPSNPDAVRVGM